MPEEQIKLPQLGETVTEGTIVKWLKSSGEAVELDEPLYEISTDKVDTEVPAPVAGTLLEIKVPEGETVEVGVVLAVLDVEENAERKSEAEMMAEMEAQADIKQDTPGETNAQNDKEDKNPNAISTESDDIQKDSAQKAGKTTSPKEVLSQKTEKKSTTDEKVAEKKVTSPVVRRLIRDSGVDESLIIASGRGGRVTRKDVELALAASKIAGAASNNNAPTAPPQVFRTSPNSETTIPLSKIRKLTAEHMRRSKDTSPHVLTAVEVDFENVEKVRQQFRLQFKEQEGFSLTYLPFIIRAVCDALSEYSHINAAITDEELIVKNYVNMAIAVDLDFEGLLAPVVKDADTKSLTEIAREVSDLAKRARVKKLKPSELEGGTFTITNPGQYGTLMQFPIINQPQVAILSTDGISRKPVVVISDDGDESITIHSVGVLALAWDHRAFDGAYVAAFLDHLRLIIEERDWEIEL